MKISAVLEESAVLPDVQYVDQRVGDRIVDLVSRKPADALRVIVQTTVAEAADRAEFSAGLLATPAHSSPKFFYDEQGSALFTAICALDEYYPTRTEAAIFDDQRAAIARALPPRAQWIDLGCGDGAKARGWLDTAHASRYVGVDIAEPWLRASLAALVSERASHSHAREFVRDPARSHESALDIVGVVTDFTRPFDLHALLAEEPDMPPVFFYPGSSIGNFTHHEARAFLASVHEHIECHASNSGKLLIGVDLVKNRDMLRAAYDDALGVTAAFNRNVLRVANRLLGADFDPAAFEHRALFDEDASRIEMQLVSTHAQTVRIGSDARRFAEGEVIVTEYSHKYTIEGFSALLGAAGFATGDRLRCWSDARGWFGVFAAEPA